MRPRHRQGPTLRSALDSAIWRLIGCALGMVWVAFWVHTHGAFMHFSHTPAPTLTREQGLMFKYGCWAGGPGHPIPHHVVVTVHGHVVYGGARLTRLALQQTFYGIYHGLKVWGFCR